MRLCLLIGVCLWASACFGLDSVDPAFAPVIRGAGSVGAMAWHPDGWLYAYVYGDKLNGQPLEYPLIRFDEEGTWDSDYQLPISDSVTAMAVLADGRILIAGSFTAVDGHTTYQLARLLSDGSVDTTFTVADAAIPSGLTIKVLEVADDGSIYLGSSGRPNTEYDEYGQHIEWPDILIRLSADGVRDDAFAPVFSFDVSDTSFFPNPISLNALLVSPEGDILAGGDFEKVNGVAQPFLARLDSSGQLAEDFRPVIELDFSGIPVSRINASKGVYALEAADDGGYYVGGYFSKVNDTSRKGMALLDASGGLDADFQVNFLSDEAAVYQILSSASEEIYLQGEFSMTSRFSAYRMFIRVDASGVWDDSFNFGFRYPEYVIQASDLSFYCGRPGGLVSGGIVQPAFGKCLSSGASDPDFVAPDLRRTSHPDSVAVLPDGRVLMQGTFVKDINDIDIPGFAVLTETGVVDADFMANLTLGGAVSLCEVLPGGRILIGGYFNTVNGLPRPRLALLEPDGTAVEAFDLGTGPDSTVNDIRVFPSGRVLLMGYFNNIGDLPIEDIALLDLTVLDKIDDPAITDFIDPDRQPRGADFNFLDDAAELPDGRIILVGSLRIGSSFHDALRLLPDGSVDESFQLESLFDFFSPNLVEAGPAGELYIGGSLRVSGEASFRDVVRILPDGSIDTAFTGPDSRCEVFKVAADGTLWCTGYFSSPAKYIAHLAYDGTPLADFDPGTSASTRPDVLVLRAPSQMYIAGSFTSVQGEARNGLARLNLQTPLQPQVRIFPNATTAGEGGGAAFQLAGVGQGETYTWKHNGVTLPDADGTSLTLGTLSLTDAGEITVEAVNTVGTTKSTATLVIAEFDLAQWLTHYGLSQSDADDDFDGVSNADEYLARTHPRQPQSRMDAGVDWHNGAPRLRWATTRARTYQIQVCNDLVSWEPYGDPIAGDGTLSEMELSDNLLAQWCFWRITVSKP